MPLPRIRIGDVFSVDCENSGKMYFQYVAIDSTQLNSQVIRAFTKTYHNREELDLNDIISGEVKFHAHVFLKIGLKLGSWAISGNVSQVGKTEVLFRDSGDYGNPKIKISNNWYIWKINEPMVRVGNLKGENRNAEIGVVVPPASVVHRMMTGEYDFLYPRY